MELWLVLETVTQQWLHPASVNQSRDGGQIIRQSQSSVPSRQRHAPLYKLLTFLFLSPEMVSCPLVMRHFTQLVTKLETVKIPKLKFPM